MAPQDLWNKFYTHIFTLGVLLLAGCGGGGGDSIGVSSSNSLAHVNLSFAVPGQVAMAPHSEDRLLARSTTTSTINFLIPEALAATTPAGIASAAVLISGTGVTAVNDVFNVTPGVLVSRTYNLPIGTTPSLTIQAFSGALGTGTQVYQSTPTTINLANTVAGAAVPVSVQMSPLINVPPVPTSPAISTTSGAAATSQVAPNDPNTTDTHTYTVTTQPSNGEASVSAAGLVSYIPNAGFSGTDSMVVTVTDQGGLTGTVSITATVTALQAATNNPPVFTGTPAIVQTTAVVGDTLTLTGTRTTDADGNTVTLSYQWKAAGVVITGATASTYRVTAAESAKVITCVVTANDGTGTANATATATTAGLTISNSAPVFTGTPAIVQTTAVVGDTLTLTGTGTSDADGNTVTLSYQWQAAGVPITGATTASYTIQSADSGKLINCVITADDGTGATNATVIATTAGINVGMVFAVNTTADSVDALPGDGICADANGFCSLRAAIQETNTLTGPNTITLPANTYPMSIAGIGEDTAATGDLDITDDLKINGAGAATTIIDGGSIDRVFQIASAVNVTLDGITIQNGRTSSADVASGGGGIDLAGGGTLTVSKSIIKNNTVVSNSGTGVGNGGGISCSWSTLNVLNSTISNNTANGSSWSVGGGIAKTSSTSLTISNSTLSGNSAAFFGGGISAQDNGVTTITNSTITNNDAAQGASGIYLRVNGGTNGIFLQNTIVANQVGGTANCGSNGGLVTDQGGNLASDNTCNLTQPTSLPNTNPLLDALGYYGATTQTHALQAGSPAINAASTTFAPSTDQRGIARNGPPDIGAYEYWVNGSPSNSSPVAVVVTPAAGVIAHYPFAGNANDTSGNGLHGTVTGAVLAPDRFGNSNQAYSFNGTSDFISVVDNPALTLGSNPFTMSLWVNFSQVNGRDPFISHDTGPGAQNKWTFWHDATGHRAPTGSALRFHVNPPQIDAAVDPWVPVTGQWYHVAVSRNGNNYTLYIDGSPVITEVDTNPIPDPVASLMIGRAEAFYFNGLIDDVFIYNRALSQSEIDSLYVEGNRYTTNEDANTTITLSGTDADGNQLTAKVTGLPTAGTLYQTADGTTLGAQITTVPTTVSNANKQVIFVPAANANGAPYATFDYVVNDGLVDSATATVTVNVTPVNDAPVLATDTGLTLNANAAATTASTAMLQTTDVDNTAAQLTYTVTVAPAKGTLKNGAATLSVSSTFTQAIIDSSGLTYTPATNQTGADSFTFTVSDGAGGSIGSTAFSINIAAPIAGTSWAAQTSGTPNWLISAVWSGTQFVATGFTGTILTSPNGVTWTARTSGTANPLSGIVWNGVQFVGVGDLGTILTSPNGVTWTAQTSGTTNNLIGVDWSGTQFVAVGNSGTILTSPDGVAWTVQTSVTANNLTSVVWSGTQFVAVGNSGTTLTSPNGVTWTAQTSGTTNNLIGVDWSGTQFVAVGLGGTILTSPNGITWTVQTSGTANSLYSVIWSGTQFVAVGVSGTILTSANGVAWTAQASGATNDLLSVAWSGTQLMAVGLSGTILLSNAEIDVDGDGLSDAMETAIGTDPNLVDSDGDGLSDGVEVFKTITNPNNSDTDSDGLNDGVETNTGTFVSASDTGTNPNVTDTDGDGADDGTEVAYGTDPLNSLSMPASFSAAATVPGTATSSVVIGDINGDGKPDMITTRGGADNVSVLLGNGAGGFSEATGSPFTTGAGTYPISVAIGDVNNDGKPDLAISEFFAGKVAVYLGDRLGGFTAAASSPFAVGTSPRTVTMGDVNKDGNLDLAVANNGSSSVSVLLGDGAGGFTVSATLSPGTNPSDVVLVDVNKDGNPDVLTANNGAGTASVLLGVGDGTFGAATPFVAGTQPFSLAVGDINHDGNPDMTVANQGSNDVTILLGNGAGSFSAATGSPHAVGAGPRYMAIGDANRDGHLDLAVASFTGGKVSLLLGDGAGGFGADNPILTAAGASDVSMGDLNNDGKPDMAVSNNTVGTISALLNTTPVSTTLSMATAVNYAVGTNPYSVAIGDTNNDGKQDMAVANYASGFVSILSGVGDGTFNAAVNYTAGTSPIFVALGDINNDGKLDLSVANYSSGNVSVLLGVGNGTFNAAVNYAAGTNPYSVTIGDVNNDGKPDMAVTNFTSNNISILLGVGDGTFSAAVNYAVGTNPVSVTIGDINNDGKPDMAVANYNSNNASVLLGVGDGTFSAAVNYAAGSNAASVAIGDVNGDGKLDMAVANRLANNASVLLGVGDGTFNAAVNYTVGTLPYAVAIGDINGDGKLDLATANYTSNNASVLLGVGDGTFNAAVNYAAGTNPIFVIIGDANNDGRPDLAVVNRTSNNVSVLLNR